MIPLHSLSFYLCLLFNVIFFIIHGELSFAFFSVAPCTSGPFGWTLPRSISSLRASLNTSFRTFRQRNSILARGNEISPKGREDAREESHPVIRILRRTPWCTIRAFFLLAFRGSRRESSLAHGFAAVRARRKISATRRNLRERKRERKGEKNAMMDTRDRGRPVFYITRGIMWGEMIYKRDN